MKKTLSLTALSLLSLSLFAHPGHQHSNMSESNTIVHLLWLFIPIIIGAIVYYVSKKRKTAKQ